MEVCKWPGGWFHKPCFAGMRKRQLIAGKVPGGLAEEVKLCKTDPDEWRRKNKGLADEDQAVVEKAKRTANNDYKKVETVKAKMNVKPMLKLSRKKLKKWKMLNGSDTEVDTDENDAEFDEIYEQQGWTIGQTYHINIL